MNPKKIALSSAVLIALCGLAGCGQDTQQRSSEKVAANTESYSVSLPSNEKSMRC